MVGPIIRYSLLLVVMFGGLLAQSPGQSPPIVQPPVLEPPVLGPPMAIRPPNPGPNSGNVLPSPKAEILPSTQIPLPNASRRRLLIAQRSATPFQIKIEERNGEDLILLTGGIKFLAIFEENNGATLDIEADQMVLWSTGGTKELFGAMREPTAESPARRWHLDQASGRGRHRIPARRESSAGPQLLNL